MNISGITGNITRNADKIGLLAGALSAGGLNSISTIIQNAAAGNIHIPDLSTFPGALLNTPQVKNGIMGALAGYVVDEFAPAGFKKYGKTLQDFSIGYIEGTAAIYLAIWATSAGMGSNPAAPDYNPNWHLGLGKSTQQNLANAPALASYNY